MLYLGQFTFEGAGRFPETNGAEEHGNFTGLVEADSIEQATEKFEELLLDLHKNDEIFKPIKVVFMESCAAIKQIPAGGMVCHFEAQLGEPPPSLSLPIFNGGEESVDLYSLSQADENGESDDDDEDEETRSAFLVFERGRE